ncbi:transcription factor Adf-1-like [Anopheles darlingi]|uniref:transcription factor Adf-1-like n=1 Tax=Anopheles darlingi TaxID=43151 RepID=UPI0021003242|nr:transcription factor Adf-1-like [Anopheles darlingi]
MDKKTHNLYLEKERCLQLIQLVEATPCLWDRRNAMYRNTFRQAGVWEEIAAKIGQPSDFCRKKWKSLQASYRTSRSYLQKSMVTGSAACSVAKPVWFAYEAMSFLQDSFDAGSSIDPLYQPEKNGTILPAIATILPPTATVSPPATNTPPPAPTTQRRMRANNVKRRCNEANFQYNGEVLKVMSGMQGVAEKLENLLSQPETEGTIFGTMAAKKLDAMSPIRRRKLILQFEKQLLAEEELRLYENHGVRID